MNWFKFVIISIITVAFVSCSKEKDLSKLKTCSQKDFANFLATKPFDKIDATSYENGTSEYWYNLFEENGKYTWDGQEWHRDNLLPLWKKYKQEQGIFSEREIAKEYFKEFLNSEPLVGIDKTSYNNGNDDFYFDLFEETGKDTWLGQEWHRDNVLPLWKKYKQEKALKSNATKSDFISFLKTKPNSHIDSSSYDFGQDAKWFVLFQQNEPTKWAGQEWHRDSVLPLWNVYKQKHNLK